MSGQGLFFRPLNIIGTCRMLLNNRISVIAPQSCGVKRDAIEKVKELKLPEKPKRPLTPYFRFINEQRHSLLQEQPNLKMPEITKMCAVQWKSLHASIKEKYQHDYQSEQEVYSKKYKEYVDKLTPTQKEGLKEYRATIRKDKDKRDLKKKIKEFEKPKAPGTAFIFYLKEQFKTSKLSYSELIANNNWRELSDDEKDKYVKENKIAKIKYEAELQAWEKKMIELGHTDLVRRSSLQVPESDSEDAAPKSRRGRKPKP